jgi:protein TonB
MDKQNRYFYVSGLLSFSLFTFFLFAFAYLLFHTSQNKTYGYKKKNYISVSITMKQVKKIQKSIKNTIAKPSQLQKSRNIDVNNLFSDVWTKKIDMKHKKKQNSKRIQQIQKKISLTKENKVTSVSQKLNKLQNSDTQAEQETASAANEVNEYLAKIQDIVYQHFNVPQNSEGNSVKTIIELDAFGKLLDFRILQYSANEALNQEADLIKARLENVVFPINPQHKKSKTIVILISKE